MLQRDETITFCCDGCSESLDTEESDFTMANAIRLELGWLVYKDKKSGDWKHWCPLCQVEMRKKSQ